MINRWLRVANRQQYDLGFLCRLACNCQCNRRVGGSGGRAKAAVSLLERSKPEAGPKISRSDPEDASLVCVVHALACGAGNCSAKAPLGSKMVGFISDHYEIRDSSVRIMEYNTTGVRTYRVSVFPT